MTKPKLLYDEGREGETERHTLIAFFVVVIYYLDKISFQ